MPVDPRAVNERCIGIEAASVSRSAAKAAPGVKKKKQGVDKADAKRGQAKGASVAKRKAGASPGSPKLSKKTKLDAPASQSSDGEGSSEQPKSEAKQHVFEFAEFKALVGKRLRVPGTWFEGDFGKKNACLFFDGTVQKAVPIAKLKKSNRPAHVTLKFKGDRMVYMITDPRSVSQYIVD